MFCGCLYVYECLCGLLLVCGLACLVTCGLRLWFSCEFGFCCLVLGLWGLVLCFVICVVMLWFGCTLDLIGSVVARYLLRGFYCSFYELVDIVVLL